MFTDYDSLELWKYKEMIKISIYHLIFQKIISKNFDKNK